MRFQSGFIAILISALAFAGCSRLFYQPDRTLHFPPEKNGFSKEDVYFEASDGTKLFGWFFKAKTTQVKGTIVQFHGNAENMSSHYASLVWLVNEGYNLFAFDYRGYGGSLGSPSQEGTHKDALAALEKGWQYHKPGQQFIIYGQSLGGVIAARATFEFQDKHRVDLLVQDSTFSSYKKEASLLLGDLGGLASALISDEYASEPYIEKIKPRILVIHDKRDRIVNIRHGIRIFNLAQGNADLWEFDKGRHVGVFAVDVPENRARFVQYMLHLNRGAKGGNGLDHLQGKN